MNGRTPPGGGSWRGAPPSQAFLRLEGGLLSASPPPSPPPFAGLNDYALLADGRRGALVGPDGGVAWLCFPGFSDGSVCAGLVGGPGGYRVAPEVPHASGGAYEEGSLVWRHRFIATGGRVEVQEALARPSTDERAVLLRRVEAEGRGLAVTVRLELAPGYGAGRVALRPAGGGVVEGQGGGVYARLSGLGRSRALGPAREARLELEAGSPRDLVLELSTRPFRDAPPVAAALWADTRRAFREEVPRLDGVHASRDARLAAAVLSGLCSPTGGLVAAVTTSLPEKAEAGRNYDYRFCWIRDQCYAGIAAARAGLWPVVDGVVGFVARRLVEHAERLRPVYTPGGRSLPREEDLPLPGYPGSGDVRRGNKAGRQFQLDCFGEALLLFAAAAKHDRLDAQARKAAGLAARALGRRAADREAGVWELAPARYTHSRLIGAAGLRAWAKASGEKRSAERWTALADRFVATARAESTRADGAWQRAPDDERLDASLLMPAVRGAFVGAEPRTRATLEAIERELVQDGYVYRFRHDERPLGSAEGAFLICQFWLALAHRHEGDRLAALEAFERGRAACGAPGLFTEELDVAERRPRGNLPQAFVHAALLEAAMALTEE